MRVVPFLFILATGLLNLGMMREAIAQVTSDGTTNTTVNQSGNNFNIINGIEKGNNLFHSFSNFSVPTGSSARFDLKNTPNITTIFSRVTGGNISHIDGLIQTLNSNNPVSLFLMNPNGIVFGQNAKLDISGSFVATTANRIKFADGTEFNATNPGATPLLTMSVPIGLQMGQTPGKITVENTGHRLGPSRFNPPVRSNNPVGLSVSFGNTLALIGSEISLDGGVLTAPSGHIELSSVNSGMVNLNTHLPMWSFDYTNVQQFGDIRFSHQALADGSGTPAGSIQFQGRNISLNDGSAALLNSQGNQDSGDIIVKASELLELKGVGTYGFFNTYLQTTAIGTGMGGDLVVSAPQVLLQDGARIISYYFGAAVGGNVSVDVTDLIRLQGKSSIDPGLNSSITAITGSFVRGRGGEVQIKTRRLQVFEGATLLTASIGTGNAGNSTINASELIEVTGESYLVPSSLLATTLNRGNVGQLTINAPKLVVQDGGSVSNTTLGLGDAGSLVVNVPNITVHGRGAISGTPSRIGARAEILSLAFQNIFNLPAFPTGNSGNLIINTSDLQITDGAIVGVDHQGIGNAGNLDINADQISLDRTGSIIATTKSGEGGSINLQNNILIMRHGSNLTATAGGTGNGGNIAINSPIVLGLENSDIVANAFQGQGGNININTQGIFGLKYRIQSTPENDITASSQFGVSGTVNINNFGVDPNSGLVQLSENVIDPSKLIATGCSANSGSSFVATGRGGVPQNPTQQVTSDVYDGLHLRSWSDIRDLSAFRQTRTATAQIPHSPKAIIQATSWHRNGQGKIELVASKSPAFVQQSLTCAGVTKS
ncbi:S-layer family protein [Nostoc sp. TCL26-01]|uniref:beta strand repeat-containing protein n=1 Tax=Nostoc sp. TCL26-01 TaxID=2576904 RepID=UPI0015B9455B|nr:S-layer family protein [Nostoc sp. TCL26-01]QLE56634.1 S-layer family protein [Nostoc sp. TCL26-01]